MFKTNSIQIPILLFEPYDLAALFQNSNLLEDKNELIVYK